MLRVVHATLFVGGVSSVLKLYRALECVFSDNFINVASMPYREWLAAVLASMAYRECLTVVFTSMPYWEWLAAVLRMLCPSIVLRRRAKRDKNFFLQWPRRK